MRAIEFTVGRSRLIPYARGVEGRDFGPFSQLGRNRPFHLGELGAEQNPGPRHPTNLSQAGR